MRESRCWQDLSWIGACEGIIYITRITGGKKEILEYADTTGALYQNADLIFDGSITEEELIQVLNIAVSSSLGYHVPIRNNGLGYNNLIYISLLLAKMQSNKEVAYMGTTNAKAFSILWPKKWIWKMKLSESQLLLRMKK